MIAAAHPPALARIRNPRLNINPSTTLIGDENAVLTGTSTRYFVPDFAGSLSLKSVLSGVSTWKVDGRELRVRESSVLTVNDRQPYSMAFDEPFPVTTFCIFFKRGFVEDIARTLTAESETLLRNPEERRPLEFPIHLLNQESVILSRLREFAWQLAMTRMTEENWNGHFLSLARAVVRQHCSDTPARAERISALKPAVRQELLSRAMIARDFMLSSSDKPITLEEISRAAALSPFHLHRTFRRAFGQSPHQFLKEHRLARAAHLLQHTKSSIDTVCRDVGFESVTSFIAAFNKRFGSSPKKFRKR